MPQPALHPDFKDLLSAFAAERVEYLLIGGYAVSFHARPRLTKDIDLLVGDTPSNLARLAAALVSFGAPDAILTALKASTAEEIVWFGVAPAREDLIVAKLAAGREQDLRDARALERAAR